MKRALILLIAAGSVIGCSGDDDAGDATPVASSTTSLTATGSTSSETDASFDGSTDTDTDTNTDDDGSEGDTSATTSNSTTSTTTRQGANTVPVSTTQPSTGGDDPPDGGGTATGALADADVVVETDEGTIQIGVADVPDGVSATFPIPADLDVQLSSATDTDFGFSGVSAGSVDELAAFYVEGLELAGYQITARQEIAGTLAVYTFERAEEFGQVAISSAPGGGGSSVLVTIGDGTSRTEVSADG